MRQRSFALWLVLTSLAVAASAGQARGQDRCNSIGVLHAVYSTLDGPCRAFVRLTRDGEDDVRMYAKKIRQIGDESCERQGRRRLLLGVYTKELIELELRSPSVFQKAYCDAVAGYLKRIAIGAGQPSPIADK